MVSTEKFDTGNKKTTRDVLCGNRIFKLYFKEGFVNLKIKTIQSLEKLFNNLVSTYSISNLQLSLPTLKG